MKHLKTKILFEKVDVYEMAEDIKDICLEIEDEGFSISYGNYNYFRNLAGNIVITKGGKGGSVADDSLLNEFKYSEVVDVVDRLKSYIGDRFIAIHVLRKNEKWKKITDIDISDPLYKCYYVPSQYVSTYLCGISINFKY